MVVLTIGSFIGFAIFLIMIQLGTMQRWEEAFALQIIQSRTPSLTRMMHFFTNLGKAFRQLRSLYCCLPFHHRGRILHQKQQSVSS